MSKRKAGTLTGGSGDYNPQNYSISVLQSAADTNTVGTFPTPIPRFGTGGSTSSPVMEILKIHFFIDDLTAIAAQTSMVAWIATANLGTAITGFTALSDPRTFSWVSLDGVFATAAGFLYQTRAYEFDLTDGSGRGLLVATDSITMGVHSVGTGRANTVGAKILYRMKNVTLQEYVGIVQSQQ